MFNQILYYKLNRKVIKMFGGVKSDQNICGKS